MFLDARLWQLTAGVRGRIWLAVLVGVLAATVGVARLALLGWLLGRIYEGAKLADLVVPVAVIAGVMVARGLLEHWRAMLAHRTAALVQLHLRQKLFEQVTALGPAHFGLTRTGDALLSLVEGVEQLETYFGEYLPQLFVAALTPLVIFALLAFLDLPLAALLLGFAWFTLLAPALFQSWDSANALRRQRAYASFAAEFLDAIQGLATLKAFGQGRARGRLLAERAREVFRRTMWVLATNSLTRGITDTGIAVGAAATLAVGAMRVEAGETSLQTLLIVLLAGVETFRPQRDLRTLLHQGMVGLSAAHGIFAMLEARPAVRWRPEPAASPARAGSPRPVADAGVRFEEVHFAYPGGRRAAHTGLDFSVAAGERVGFVGASGAGKSTIVKLLLRFHDPSSGRVLVGGRDLRDMSADELYAQVAVVSQDTYLFHGSVAENLRFGCPDASDEQLWQAARLANAYDFIERLPHGLATVIGERGVRLSGGQRQRIAIARALLRDAPILVLDEALSAVDAENEADIQQALDRLMRGRTTLVFAHRLSSVVGCKRILALGDGRVQESGSHAELMARRGLYHRLMASQVEGDDFGDADLDSLPGERPGEMQAPAARNAPAGLPADDILRADGLGWGGVLRELGAAVANWKGRLVLTFAFGMARVAAFIGVGVCSALVVAAVRSGEDYGHLLTWLFVLAGSAGLLHWLESWVAHDMAFRMLAELRVKLYRKLEALAPAFLLRRRSGDLVAIATHDVELVEYFFAHTVAPAFVAVLVPGAVLAVLFAQGWIMGLALLPFLAMVAVSPFLFRARIDELGSRARESLAELNAQVVDSVQGLHELVAFRQAGRRRDAFLERVRAHLAIRLPFLRELSWQTSALEVATGLGGLAVVVSGAWMVRAGQLDANLLPMLTLLALAAFLPVSEIAQIGRQLSDTLGATRRLHAVHSEPVPVTDGAGVAAEAREAGGPALEVQAATFRYGEGLPPALNEVAFEISPGATVALVGPSGAGKTTVAHLLLRFFDPESGCIRLWGHDLRDYGLEELRASVALVGQDTYLFNETLRANIIMARPDADEVALAEALRRAALSDFVDSLPDGLETPVGERGLSLSGGQRQRVAIARAFLKDAPVLVLDEATSHLDAVSEAAVRHAMEELMSERTTLVIAHRLSTVRNADRIVVMRAGRVVEQGSHAELLASGGLYRRLVSRQLAAAAG